MHAKDYQRIDHHIQLGKQSVQLAKELIDSILASAYIRDVISRNPEPSVFLQGRERRSGVDRRRTSHAHNSR